MAEIITMPRLSDTMTEGVVAQWLKNVGDKVAEGDILAEIETDKATMEFESFNEGTLLFKGLEDGQSAPVDSLLAIIGEDGEDIEAIIKDFKIESKASQEPVEQPVKSEPVKTATKAPVPAPAAAAPVATSPAPKVSTGRVIASPLAKKLAEEKGIDLNTVAGTGENGRIIKKDVEDYVPVVASAAPQGVQTIAAGVEHFEETANSQMRKTIARRLAESKFNAPHYYLMLEIDMDNAISSRISINELPDTKVANAPSAHTCRENYHD